MSGLYWPVLPWACSRLRWDASILPLSTLCSIRARRCDSPSIRVVLTTALGYLSALQLPHWLGIDPKWGVAGLTASAGISGWVEFALLRRALGQRIGQTPLPADFTLKLWSIAFVGAGLSFLVKQAMGAGHPIRLGMIVLPLYGLIYFAGTMLAGIDESNATINSVLRRFRRAA